MVTFCRQFDGVFQFIDLLWNDLLDIFMPVIIMIDMKHIKTFIFLLIILIITQTSSNVIKF